MLLANGGGGNSSKDKKTAALAPASPLITPTSTPVRKAYSSSPPHPTPTPNPTPTPPVAPVSKASATATADTLERRAIAVKDATLPTPATATADTLERRAIAVKDATLPTPKPAPVSPGTADTLERRAIAVKDATLPTPKPAPVSPGTADTLERRAIAAKDATLPTPAPVSSGTADTLERRALASEKAANGNVDHYGIELRAWIPQASVVDPLESANRYKDAPLIPVKYESQYRGDNHTIYDGSSRASSEVEFDYNKDTGEMTNFRVKDSENNISATSRDWSWTATATDVITGAGVEEAKGSGRVYGQQTDSDSFSMGFSATNRVQDEKIPGDLDTPSIDSRLDGSISANGEIMTLKYDTDLFPSHGLRVIKNGEEVLTGIVRDASGVPTQGVLGAGSIFIGLTSQVNEGEIKIPIG
jgi:hypothetical protein